MHHENGAWKSAAAGALALYVVAAIVVTWRQSAVDYPVYLIAARGFLDGADVYRWGHQDFARVAAQLGIARFESAYLYPPLTALLVVPLLALPYSAGLFVWTLANGVATVATGIVLGRLAGAQRQRRVIEISIWLLVPAMSSLYAGQVNPIVVFVAACALRALVLQMDLAAGLFLALSLLLKPLAIGVLLYAAWRSRWRVVIAAAVSGAVGITLCWSIFGAQALTFADRVAVWTPRSYPPAQNLPGLVVRWLADSPVPSDLGSASNMTLLAAGAASIALLLATLALCWPPGRTQRVSTSELACVLLAVVIANPRTWYHHYAILALPIAILVANPRRRGGVWWIAGGGAYALIQLFGVGWHHLGNHRLVLDSATLGALLLWVLTLIDMRLERSPALAGANMPGSA